MSLDSKNNQKEEINVPDFTELWKEIYFNTEAAWAEIFKELISTQAFVSFLNKSLESNLAYEKITRQTVDKYMEMSPVPSKKDIARVAELVISLEEKIDGIEFQFNHTISNMADSLLKMVDYQANMKEELLSLRQDLNKLEKKLEIMNKKLTTLNKELEGTKKKAKTTESNNNKNEEKES
ncbi:MAG: hypothetical protein GX790_09595 [Syntrophomonadaceae bacterium]|nr:hypothetical protein [Syntrophomonadaceae bacterium]